MDLQPILAELAGAGLIDAGRTTARPLTGGVSSDIWLLEDGRRQLVVKQALAKLRVAADWRADPGRNAVEQRYLRFVGELLPEAVPAVRYTSRDRPFFAMDYLGGAFEPWKKRLLAGEADAAVAERIGVILGTIHRETWERDDLRATFDTTDWFDQLRLDPYLRATAAAHPVLRGMLEAEARRIAQTRLCLVHGDYSPKNLLVAPGRVVIVDCEVAWYGDPTFDVAFLLNHLVLKALHLPEHRDAMIGLARSAWRGYAARVGRERAGVVMANLPRLLLMLMLARIDGKSPVEYITADGPKRRVRSFVAERLPRAPAELDTLLDLWKKELEAA